MRQLSLEHANADQLAEWMQAYQHYLVLATPSNGIEHQHDLTTTQMGTQLSSVVMFRPESHKSKRAIGDSDGSF